MVNTYSFTEIPILLMSLCNFHDHVIFKPDDKPKNVTSDTNTSLKIVVRCPYKVGRYA